LTPVASLVIVHPLRARTGHWCQDNVTWWDIMLICSNILVLQWPGTLKHSFSSLQYSTDLAPWTEHEIMGEKAGMG